MLAGQVFDCRIKLKITVQTIAAADVDLLVSLSQVAVGQKHCGTERRIEEKRTAVSTANKVSAQRQRQLVSRISEINTADVRSAIERPVSYQRRKCSDRNRWEQWIERWEKLVAGKRTAHHSIEIGICSACGEAVTKTQIKFGFRAE